MSQAALLAVISTGDVKKSSLSRQDSIPELGLAITKYWFVFINRTICTNDFAGIHSTCSLLTARAVNSIIASLR
jgi:hypothetical protein